MAGDRGHGDRARARGLEPARQASVDRHLGIGIAGRLVAQQRRRIGVRHRELEVDPASRKGGDQGPIVKSVAAGPMPTMSPTCIVPGPPLRSQGSMPEA